MVSKIIKQGTERALGIQNFPFSGKGTESIPNIEKPPWPDLSDAPDPSPDTYPPKDFLAAPAIDSELIAREAYEKGFQEGELTGRQTAEKPIEAAMKRYADSFVEISSLKPSLYAQAEHEVVKLAIEIARKIVHREIQVDRNIIQTFVRVALSHVTEKSSVKVNLNPVDYKYVMECRDELGQTEGSDLLFQSDNSIEQGGCLVETKCGNIDARIEEKFREVEHAFFEDMK